MLLTTTGEEATLFLVENAHIFWPKGALQEEIPSQRREWLRCFSYFRWRACS
jgi:hypothetical protein